jgi:hypothetical protein
MRTSNKLLVVITIIVVAYMVVFDAGLKAEYLKGDFKDPLFGMEKMPIKDFTNIEHLSANVLDATIEKGPEFTVLIRKDLKDKVKLTKQGNTLVIEYIGPIERRGMYYGGGIKIFCPQLNSITTKAFMPKISNEEDRRYQQTDIIDDIDVVGFDQPKMVLNAGPLTQIELKDNKLDNMESTVGDNTGYKGGLNINANNSIKVANIKVLGNSELKMTNPKIGSLQHDISDNASLVLTGSALRLLK